MGGEPDMHGLVTLLPSPHYELVEAVWKELEEDCGLRGIKVTPYPHFSWQIAQDYDFPSLEQVMHSIATSVSPLQLRTTGIGIFTGPRPVIFIPLVKTAELIELHTTIWERTQEVAHGLSPYYSPEVWMPHISLAYDDVDKSNIAGVMAKLAFRSFTWEMLIDNIALIYEPSGETGRLEYQFNFSAPAARL